MAIRPVGSNQIKRQKMAEGKGKLKNSVLALSDQVVVSAGSFLSGIIICRNTSEADFGVFCLAWSIISFLRVVQERMIAAPYLAYTFRPSFNRKTYRGSSISHQVFFAALISCIVMVASIIAWILGYDSGLVWQVPSLAFAMFFSLARDQMRAVSFTDFTFLRLLVLDFTVVATQLLGLVMLVWFDFFSLTWANLTLGFGCIGPVVVWLWLTKSQYSFELKAMVVDWYHNWNYAQWLVGSRLLGIAPMVLIPLLIVRYEGDEGNAIYGVCCSLVGVSAMFASGFNNLFQARTVLELQRNGIRGMIIAIGESMVVVSLVLTCLSGIFLFWGGNLLAIFGSQYTKFGFLTFLLSVSTLVVSFSAMFGYGLAALQKSRDFFWGEVSCGIVSIVSALLLLPNYGLNGAAYATILGGFAATLVTALTLARGVRLYEPNPDSTNVMVGSVAMKSK